MKNKRRAAMVAAAFVLGIVLAIGAGAALLGFWPTAGIRHHQSAPAVDYVLLDGTPATLAQLRGKVVLVNFWATSCAVCVAEMPQIVATHRRFEAQGYETLAVAMRYDPPALVLRYAERHALPFRVAMDHSGSIAKGFGDVDATPTSVLINRRGEIVERIVGRPDFTRLDALVTALLAES